MKRFALLFCFLVFSGPVFAAPSLFFTENEIALIEEEIARHPQDFSARDKNRLSLESVLYIAPDRWSLWIDGEKWTPQTRKNAIEILEVTPDAVRLRLLPPRVAAPFETTLRAHQSLDPATGIVSEGR